MSKYKNILKIIFTFICSGLAGACLVLLNRPEDVIILFGAMVGMLVTLVCILIFDIDL